MLIYLTTESGKVSLERPTRAKSFCTKRCKTNNQGSWPGQSDLPMLRQNSKGIFHFKTQKIKQECTALITLGF